jgi:hypothetical protein
MSVVAIHELPEPEVRVGSDSLLISNIEVNGAIFEAAQQCVESGGDPVRLVESALEIGGTALLQGQSRATIESVSDEIDRLVKEAGKATEAMPVEVETRLNKALEQLAKLLEEHFDPKRTTSVQSQISGMVDATTVSRVKQLTGELLDEQNGPLTRMNQRVVDHLKRVDDTVDRHLQRIDKTQKTLISNVASLVKSIEGQRRVNEATERSSTKGLPFQEVIGDRLEALLCPLGDEVRCVANEYGLVAGLKQVGDYLITVDPQETGGRKATFVVEVKTGKLNKAKTHEELDNAIENRGAAAGVIVFDSTEDAPTGGRRYCTYPGGKFITVLDPEDADGLAFEVAITQARSIAIASVRQPGGVDTTYLLEQCDRLSEVIENANAIKHGANYAQRGIDRVQAAYGQLRSEAQSLLAEIHARLTDNQQDTE